MGLRVDAPGVQLSQVLHTRFRSGTYTLLGNNLVTSNALGNAQLRVYPVEVAQIIRISRIGAEVTAAGDAGSTLRLGIYADDGAGVPGALVLDAGAIPTDAVAVAELVTDVTLQPGLYHVGGAVQGVTVTQPTIRCVNNPAVEGTASLVGAATPGAAAASIAAQQAAIGGALPAAFTFNLFVNAAPRIFVKVV